MNQKLELKSNVDADLDTFSKPI